MSDPKDTSKSKNGDATASTGSTDVVLLHSPTEDGKGVRVLRAREGRIEAGEIRAIEEGRPLHGDVVKLKPREATPQICDVEVTYKLPRAEAAESAEAHVGPAKVTTSAYRSSWDRIFGGRTNDAKTPRKDELN